MLYLTGDLIAAPEPVIGHGCNLSGVMGAGIARQIRSTYPGAYTSYRSHFANGRLGGFDIYMGDRVVVNLYTQPRPGRCADLDAIHQSVLGAIEALGHFGHRRLALPRIGAGLGGLHWADVFDVLCDIEDAHPDFTLAVYAL